MNHLDGLIWVPFPVSPSDCGHEVTNHLNTPTTMPAVINCVPSNCDSPKYLPPWDVRYQTTVPRPVVRMLGPASLVWWNTPGDFCLSGEAFSPWGNGSLLWLHLFYLDFLATGCPCGRRRYANQAISTLVTSLSERTWCGCLPWLGSALCSWLPGNNKHLALWAIGRDPGCLY